MDETTLTVAAFEATADAYECRFMDCSAYGPVLAAFAALPPAGARVLDLGCGPGNVARHLLGLRSDLRVTGVDLSPAMVERFRKNVPGADARVLDLRRVGELGAGWDAAVASFCLPFFRGDEAATFVVDLGRLLVPGGHLYLSTMQGSGRGFEQTSFGGEHEFFFNYHERATLDRVLAAAGFEVLSYREQLYPQAPAAALIDMIYLARR